MMQETADTVVVKFTNQEEVNSKIFELIYQIRSNTIPTDLTQTDLDEYANLILAGVAAIGTLLTAYFVWKEYKQDLIDKSIQTGIFKDLLRHYYRNFIVLKVIEIKLKKDNFNSYPSEEHFLKFKTLPEELRIIKFKGLSNNYDQLHSFELILRNVNIEIDVYLMHLKDPHLTKEIKEEDIMTLYFKFSLISYKILDLFAGIDKKVDSKKLASDHLKNESIKNQASKKSKTPYTHIEEIDLSITDSYFFKELELTSEIETDLSLEYNIVRMIPLPKLPQGEAIKSD
ncbi:hypothetical protein [Aquiflexum gelatinilyticum]|uniref:hypothetical protein n=1 Tax=Aquiflexum gelatinilyticum TaxID=2961943 RepID=UPI00216A2478|nr:hypothetical protein [Aquiflexum gelatinilyticum]MCS4435433.1 hypothetical protein [Aquiflexum gelatinilyticum]